MSSVEQHKITKQDFNKICRICLKENSLNNMYSIYKVKILQMFMACTSINVNSTSQLPNHICSVCLLRMNETYDFRQLCENSNRILLNIIDNETKEECKPQIKVEQTLTDTKKFDTIIDDFEDNYIADETKLEKYDSDDNLTTKCSKKELNIESTVLNNKNDDCNENGLLFSEQHTVVSSIKRKTNSEPVICTVCNQKFSLPQQLSAHVKMLHSTKNDYICSKCGKIFPKGHLLRKHQKHHATERIHHCLQCDKSFKVESILRLHYRRCHLSERKKEICTVCGKSVLNIKAHSKTHNTAKPFECSDCTKVFGNKYNLEEHRKRKHRNPGEPKKRPYLCSICGKGSVSSTGLKIHLQHIHTVGKTYPCRVCNKKFKTKIGVNAHIRYTHDNDRRFSCSVCSKSFQTNAILKIHMRVHTGEKPFVCKLCNKSFSQPSTLKTHMKVHGCDAEKNLTNYKMENFEKPPVDQ